MMEPLRASEPASFLDATEIIDWKHPGVSAKAAELALGLDAPEQIASRCFEWVRDTIAHSADCQRNPVTCAASEVLRHGTGYCYAKSHLLAALLRANGIPAGFCYQRLRLDEAGTSLCLHGFNAVYLPDHGWYRIDARGNKAGVNAQFCPPQERLAYAATLAGERDFPEIFPAPLPVVIGALRRCHQWEEVLRNLPDWDPAPLAPAPPL